jgi:pre-rRNA-processing protein RIX1
VANKRQKSIEPQAIAKDIEDERVMVPEIVMGDSDNDDE